MTGNYVAVNDKILQQVINQELDIPDIDSEQYPTLDIDKSWQAINFLLYGDIDEGEAPLGYVVPMMVDNHIEAGMEYGAFYLTASQVADAYQHIKDLSESELKGMYDFDSFVENEIYPVVEDEDADDFFNYLYENFKAIQEFYQSASEKGLGVVFYIM